MTVKEYVVNYLPEHFNVHPAFSKIVELIYSMELEGYEEFKNERFKTIRERAELALPYQIKDIKERERVLNILEIILRKHRQEKHNEDHSKEIKDLIKNTNMSAGEYDMIISPKGFWNG